MILQLSPPAPTCRPHLGNPVYSGAFLRLLVVNWFWQKSSIVGVWHGPNYTSAYFQALKKKPNALNRGHSPSRQILVPRSSRELPPPTSPGRSLKILFDRPGDVPIRRPGDVLIWRSREVPERLVWDVPRTFSGRPLEDLKNTQTWMSKFFFKLFFQNLLGCPNLKAFQHSSCIENPVKLLKWSIFCKIS